MIGSIARQDIEVAIVSAVLLLILFVVYFSKPQKAQKTILKHSIRVNATLNVQDPVSDTESTE